TQRQHKERAMTSQSNDSHRNDSDTDTRKTAMLIFRDEGVDWAQLASDGRSKALFQKLVDWAADLKRRGLYAGVEALAQSGKTVRRKGAGLVIDGPFAEGREAVLGFFLVRVSDIDEACAIAGESPHAEVGGATEVRMLGAFPKP
ncbi:MAG TPA: YciI family protein, partial [Usitatibacter sp.]